MIRTELSPFTLATSPCYFGCVGAASTSASPFGGSVVKNGPVSLASVFCSGAFVHKSLAPESLVGRGVARKLLCATILEEKQAEGLHARECSGLLSGSPFPR